jgi:hypothetical protein
LIPTQNITQAAAAFYQVEPGSILRIEEWRYVFFVMIKGRRPTFCRKKDITAGTANSEHPIYLDGQYLVEIRYLHTSGQAVCKVYEFTRKRELSAINVRIRRLADLQEAPPDRRLPKLETAKVSVKLQRKWLRG